MDTGLHPLTCILGHPRPVVMERLLRDFMTFGIESIIVAASELGEKSYLQSNLWQPDRLQRTMIAAAKLAGATTMPDIERCTSVRHALAIVDGRSDAADARYLFEPDAARFGDLPALSSAPRRAIIAVGPERGWSEREQQLMRAHGFTPVSLGVRLLRVEAAAISALALTLLRAGWL